MGRRLLPAVALLLLASRPADAYRRGGHAHGRSAKGQMVHRPTRGSVDYDHVTAMRGDGSRPSPHHHRGACPHHGGVAG